MKALSMKQPWAGLVGHQLKTIETRKWRTHYRGDLLICASKTIHKEVMEDLNIAYLCELTGVAICAVTVVDCVPMEKKHESSACCAVYPGAWAWMLENIRLVKHIPVKGQLSLFDVDVNLTEILDT